MNHPPDISDPKIAKAYAHPLRIEIMGLLDNRVASPRELATELGASLATTSYHVRQLAALELITLVRRRQTRGAIEHFYTASIRPRLQDQIWGQLPTVVKRAIIGGRLAQLGKELFVAAEAGGFDQEDIHLTRIRMTLSHEGWREAGRVLAAALAELDELKAREARRISSDPDLEAIEATAALMLFETAAQTAKAETRALDDDDLADIAPPTAR